MQSIQILTEENCVDGLATYFAGLAFGCWEAASTADSRVRATMLGVLQLAPATIRELAEREVSES